MKLIVISILLLIMHQNAWTQALTLSGDALLHIKSEGITFSVGSLILSDRSKLIGSEGVILKNSDFIQLNSPEAIIQTSELVKFKTVQIPVGIYSKTVLIITNTGGPASYLVQMEVLSEEDALPFSWSIKTISSDPQTRGYVVFNWEKAVEPESFDFKALVEKVGDDWDIIRSQRVGEARIMLTNFSDYKGTVKNFTRDLDGDGVPDIVEIMEETEFTDPLSYLDEDGDLVPDYLEVLEATDNSDIDNFKDVNNDNIPDYLSDRSPIAYLNLEDLAIEWGFSSFESLLQQEVISMLGSGKLVELQLNWDTSEVNVFARGKYIAVSDLDLPPGVFNVYNLYPEIDIEVLPKLGPTDLLLNNSEFIGSWDDLIIPIGGFTVLDSFDDVHTIELSGEGYDNVYFEIEDNLLSWNSVDRPYGRTKFTILVRVTDRDGNVLEKLFDIKRLRSSISEVDLPNTFSPNNDGSNDAWGAEDLLFYTGVRIQIFDRGGVRVFYTEDPAVRWDGRFNGKEMGVGTYYWIIEVKETGEIRRGVLNLLSQ